MGTRQPSEHGTLGKPVSKGPGGLQGSREWDEGQEDRTQRGSLELEVLRGQTTVEPQLHIRWDRERTERCLSSEEELRREPYSLLSSVMAHK